MSVPVIKISGIGPKTAEYLKASGIHTVLDLIKAGPQSLISAPGFSPGRAAMVFNNLQSSDDHLAKVKGDKGKTEAKMKKNKRDNKSKKDKTKKDKKKNKKAKKDKKNKKGKKKEKNKGKRK